MNLAVASDSAFPVLVLASRNAKKAAEIEAQLSAYNIQVKPVSEFSDVGEVVEDGSTFGENAAKKASEVARATGHWAIGEDSGVCVDALNGEPGIYSARYSGEAATDQKNNALLVQKLSSVPEQKRAAHYVCHIALSDPSGQIRLQVERTCGGRIVLDPKGENGFGYDPHFLVLEYNQTFGELPAVVKKSISHRARAFQEFLPKLVRLLRESQ